MLYANGPTATEAARTSSPPARPDHPRVDQAITLWDDTFDKGDAAALAAFYTSDAYVLPPTHSIVQGPAAIQQFFETQFANHVTGHLLVPFDIIPVGDSFIVSSNWSAQARDSNGKPIKIGGLSTHVFVGAAGQPLKLRIHTFN